MEIRMKSTLKPLALFLCMVFSSNLFAHATIGVFDVNRAILQTDAWSTELETLENQYAEEQETVSQLREELEELFATIESNAATLTETEL